MLYRCMKASRIKMFFLLVILLIAGVVAVMLSGRTSVSSNAALNKNRIVFIKSLGIKVDGENYSVKSVVIPVRFGDVYNCYNELQKSAGYDLKNYAGKLVTQYTYRVEEPDTERVNLLVYKQKIIGGDISSSALRGCMRALLPAEKQ